MAVITRYFSTASAGTGDGTSWANRAPLLDGSGNWSGIIKGFDFSGTDSLRVLIGPGTYTITETLQSSVFINAPTQSNDLLIASCDASGDPLDPPDPDWVSSQPVWDLTNVPKIETGNITLFNLKYLSLFNLQFEVEGVTTVTLNEFESAEWLYILNYASGTSVQILSMNNGAGIHNCCFVLTGSGFRKGIDIATTPRMIDNVRLEATGSPTTGDRYGIEKRGNSGAFVSRCTVIGCMHGFRHSNIGTNSYLHLIRCMAIDSISDGATAINTNTDNKHSMLSGCVIIGSGGYGMNAAIDQSRAVNSRLRDNTSGNTTDGNDPLHLCETGAGTNADEFVDAANGDYRIKNTSDLWGRGIGAGDEPASGGGSPVTRGWAI